MRRAPTATPPGDDLPELPLAEWVDTKRTIHLYLQVVGKVRLGLHPPLNHWWHAPLYVTVRGFSTRAIPSRGRLVEVEFDVVDHDLVVRSDAAVERLPLRGRSIAHVHRDVVATLADLGHDVRILARPYDPERVGSDVPFERDTDARAYDPDAVRRFHRVLAWSHGVFTEFAGRFVGKSSPVHFFWHSLDLALTRFSGRPVVAPSGNAVDREAYSHEVVSFGFWAGDDAVPEPAFYSYTAPEPAGLADHALEPAAADWRVSGGSSLALLRYDDVRAAADARLTLLEFLESTYRAGASRAGWDLEALRHRSVADDHEPSH